MLNVQKFSDWITKKYLEWQAKQGKRKTLEEFAAYLGVSRPLLNMWINGDKPRPGPANIRLLAEIVSRPFENAPSDNLPIGSLPVGAPLYRHSLVIEYIIQNQGNPQPIK